jgi:hypothetical protein
MRASFVTAIIAAAIAYGLYLATANKPAPNLTAMNNVIINVGAGEVGLTPEAFTAIVKAAIGDKKSVAESALKFVAPARASAGSSVTIDDQNAVAGGASKLEINAAAIAETPPRIELDANERIEEYKATKLVIRATNLDSKKSGWAGKLGTREERLPIELDPLVNEADIFGRTSVTVDAALVFKEKGRSKELTPARIFIRRVLKPGLP